jgi:ankyrin repeat protein
MSVIIAACKSQEATLETIQALLSSGDYDLDFQEPETGDTALLTALAFYREDAALEIIRRGANIDLANVNGVNPLMRACFRSLKSAAQELALRVIDMEAADNPGRTALSWAAFSSPLEIVKMLVYRGAHVTTKGVFGRSLLHQALMGGNLAVAEYLLSEYGIFSIHDRDTENNQALHLVGITGQVRAAQWLIGRGAEVDGTGNCDGTPLMVASQFGNIDVARVLVRAGAEINRTGQLTALGHAAFQGHTSMAQELLLWGADPCLVGISQETARQAAVRRGHHGTSQLLEAWRSIQVVWTLGSVEQVRRLGKNSVLKRLPKELVRVVWSMLV